MPLIQTRGSSSISGYGGASVSSTSTYIEDVFSTYLYTGNGSTQTITNGIDLSGKGGLVWSKCRSSDLGGNGIHTLIDTVRGAGYRISSELTGAEVYNHNTITAFSSTGFSIGNSPINNTNAATFVSWTFRKQPKFFDVVTWTGNGSNGRQIAHSLGVAPGMIIVKCLNNNTNWWVWHRGLSSQTNGLIFLEQTAAQTTDSGIGYNIWNSTAPTSSAFTVGSTGFSSGSSNAIGATYVAYLFAHNAGGFGLSGSENVISCGSFTTDAGGLATVNLGYEPQWLLVKCTSNTDNWDLMDTMRGWNMTTTDATLYANLSNAESDANWGNPTATGFDASFGASRTYIYIAIRRGPMKVPTSGTSVFSPNAVADDSSAITTNFPVDGYWEAVRTGNPNNFVQQSRLTGGGQYLTTSSTAAENNTGFTTVFQNNTGYTPGTFGSSSLISYAYRRAPGFFDVVCYTGTGAASQSYNHNLGVAPELMLVKVRSASGSWAVYSSALGASTVLTLNATDAAFTSGSVFSAYWGSAAPTSSVFSVGSIGNTGGSGSTYVAYLFATCPGVSKVGSYTGNGTNQTINCGFTGGARFVLIKRTDSTGDWYVWDTARGIIAGNDPHLSLNTTAAEVTTNDSIDTDSTGFIVNQLGATNINVSSATYIYLAIA